MGYKYATVEEAAEANRRKTLERQQMRKEAYSAYQREYYRKRKQRLAEMQTECLILREMVRPTIILEIVQ